MQRTILAENVMSEAIMTDCINHLNKLLQCENKKYENLEAD